MPNINNETNQTKETELIYNDITSAEKYKRNKIFAINAFITAIFNFLEEFMEILFYIIYPNEDFEPYVFSSTVPFDIILQFISSYFILKIYFYKLQYFSLSINIIIFIIILIIDIVNFIYKDSFPPIIFLFNSFNLIFSSLEDVFGKKAIFYGFTSVYILIFMTGFIKIVLAIILSVILIITNKDIFSQMSVYFSETKYILLIIGNIIISFLDKLFYWLIIDRFNPNYAPLAIILEELCYYIDIKIIHSENFEIMGWDEYFRLFLYIILFVGVMIHNEIIIINICGLASETKYFLDLKVKNEEEYSDSNSPDIIKRYETIFEMESISDNSTNK